MVIGVVVVTYGAAGVIAPCLESLFACTGAELRIVVVDNASPDGTVAVIEAWAQGRLRPTPQGLPFRPRPHGPVALVRADKTPEALSAGTVGLIRLPENRGFAAGVNAGLRCLQALPEVAHFWILNPDCMAVGHTASALLECAGRLGRYGVIGGRVHYCAPDDMIQSEGGRVNFLTGVCVPFNLGRSGPDVPSPAAGQIDYVAGAHMLVSRAFLETAGPMPEDYFLFYEEVDWCLRRGELPLATCPEAVVYHHAGHSIGSATLERGPSPLAAYFMARSKIRFIRRYRPLALPFALAHSLLKALRHLAKGHRAAARGMLRGTLGMKPDAEVLARIGRRDLPG